MHENTQIKGCIIGCVILTKFNEGILDGCIFCIDDGRITIDPKITVNDHITKYRDIPRNNENI